MSHRFLCFGLEGIFKITVIKNPSKPDETGLLGRGEVAE